MTDRIEAIRARLESREAFRVRGVTTWTSEADDDMEVLLAEVERLMDLADNVQDEHNALRERLIDEWAATDGVSVELEQWPTIATIRATREAAHLEFVHDGDDVLLHRYVSDWAPVAPDAEPEILGGAPGVKHYDATYPTDGEQPGPDWRPLSEDVTGHTMGPARSHADGRICMYHHRLNAWTWDFVSECLRDHEDPR